MRWLVLILIAACGSSPAGGDDDDGPAPDAAVQTQHVAVSFDDLPSSTTLIAQYADKLTFSSEAGVPIKVEDLIAIDQSPPNYLSAGGGSDVRHPMYVAFTHPVHGLTFHALSVTSTGTIAHIRVYQGATLAGTEDLVGHGDSFTAVPVDLSAYTDVTKIEIVDITDLYGIVYDDFAFDQ